MVALKTWCSLSFSERFSFIGGEVCGGGRHFLWLQSNSLLMNWNWLSKVKNYTWKISEGKHTYCCSSVWEIHMAEYNSIKCLPTTSSYPYHYASIIFAEVPIWWYQILLKDCKKKSHFAMVLCSSRDMWKLCYKNWSSIQIRTWGEKKKEKGKEKEKKKEFHLCGFGH